MIERTLKDWRALPTLTVRETAELVGLSAQTVEAHVLPQLEVRLIGRTVATGLLCDSTRSDRRRSVSRECG